MKGRIATKAGILFALAFIGLNQSAAQEPPPQEPCDSGSVVGSSYEPNGHCCTVNRCGFPPAGWDVKSIEIDYDGDGDDDCTETNYHYILNNCWC